MTVPLGVGIPAPLPTAPAAVPLTPRILWPSLARASPRPEHWEPVDLDAFPDAQVIGERRARGEAFTCLPSFKTQVTDAIERILVLDTYLLCGGERAEDEVLSWLPDTLEATDIRIACGGLKVGRDVGLFKARLADRMAAINKRKARSGAPATEIKLKVNLDPSSHPFVHDRFAVLDEELWHFGATVGGLHHGVNAVTRGWGATSTGAISFFGLAWNQRARGGGVRTVCGTGMR